MYHFIMFIFFVMQKKQLLHHNLLSGSQQSGISIGLARVNFDAYWFFSTGSSCVSLVIGLYWGKDILWISLIYLFSNIFCKIYLRTCCLYVNGIYLLILNCVFCFFYWNINITSWIRNRQNNFYFYFVFAKC